MRGLDTQQSSMFSYLSPEQRVPSDHPLRRIRQITDRILGELTKLFEQMYSKFGRPSIPPEKLLRALLLQVLYSARSERMLIEQLEYNLLFRWFVGLNMDDRVWDVTVFTKNRDRLLKADVAKRFFELVVAEARNLDLMSDEHFTVDGTLLEACAGLKSFRKTDQTNAVPPDDPGNPTVNFRGERRGNATHASITDSDALLARKGAGKEAKLCFGAHVLMENRHGLCVDLQVTPANPATERTAALAMLRRLRRRGFRPRTVGGDKGYDTRDFVTRVRGLRITPHVAQQITAHRGSWIDARTTRHGGYAVSQRVRKRVEEVFGWMKTVGGLRRTRYRGLARTGLWAYVVASAYNLIRLARLQQTALA